MYIIYVNHDSVIKQICQLRDKAFLISETVEQETSAPPPKKNPGSAPLTGLFSDPSMTTLGSLSKDVFEPRTSTGSEAFSLFIYLDSNKFVLLRFFSLIMRIYSRVSTKPLPNDAKRLLPVEVRRSKTLLLKLPIIALQIIAQDFHVCFKIFAHMATS